MFFQLPPAPSTWLQVGGAIALILVGASGAITAIGYFLRVIRTPSSHANGNSNTYAMAGDLREIIKAVGHLTSSQQTAQDELAEHRQATGRLLELMQRFTGDTRLKIDAIELNVGGIGAVVDRLEPQVKLLTERLLQGKRRGKPDRRGP